MIIYRITNKLNGKKYIGQTIKSLEKRLYKHLWEGSQSYISRAIRRYGKDNFLFETIDIAASKEELNEKEIFYIKKENSMYPDGYNLNSGGNVHLHSESTKRKISFSNSGKNNYWYGKFGENHHSFGKKCSEETKRKISESNSGKPKNQPPKSKQHKINHANSLRGKTFPHMFSEKTKQKMEKMRVLGAMKMSKKIICNETGEQFDSQIDCCRKLKIQKFKLYRHLSGVLKDINGLTYKRQDGTIKNSLPRYVNKGINYKKIICENVLLFNSTKEAASYLKIKSQNIKACALGYNKTASGLRFEYASF